MEERILAGPLLAFVRSWTRRLARFFVFGIPDQAQDEFRSRGVRATEENQAKWLSGREKENSLLR